LYGSEFDAHNRSPCYSQLANCAARFVKTTPAVCSEESTLILNVTSSVPLLTMGHFLVCHQRLVLFKPVHCWILPYVKSGVVHSCWSSMGHCGKQCPCRIEGYAYCKKRGRMLSTWSDPTVHYGLGQVPGSGSGLSCGSAFVFVKIVVGL